MHSSSVTSVAVALKCHPVVQSSVKLFRSCNMLVSCVRGRDGSASFQLIVGAHLVTSVLSKWSLSHFASFSLEILMVFHNLKALTIFLRNLDLPSSLDQLHSIHHPTLSLPHLKHPNFSHPQGIFIFICILSLIYNYFKYHSKQHRFWNQARLLLLKKDFWGSTKVSQFPFC